jgi:CBS domain-containing protein
MEAVMQARDVMTEQVITVTPDAAVTEVARLLLEKGISAVPVKDAEGEIIGMVSEADLMHRVEIGRAKPRRWWITLSQAELADAYAKTHGLKARDVMHEGVHSVSPETDLMDVVSTMERLRIKRVLVMEDRRLRGIVTRSNLLRAFLAGRVALEAKQGDRAIRATILEELGDQLWTTITSNNVMVVDGVVRFWGHVSSDEERKALRAAAENVPGVKRVEDHTVLLPGGPVYWE